MRDYDAPDPTVLPSVDLPPDPALDASAYPVPEIVLRESIPLEDQDCVVRFEWTGNSPLQVEVCMKPHVLVARRWSREDGVVHVHRERPISNDDWSRVDRAIASAHLESIPPSTLSDAMTHSDGQTWSIRVNRAGRVRDAAEWSPGKDAFRDACEVIVDLAGRDVMRGLDNP